MAASLKSSPPSSCVSPLWAYIFSLVSYNDICPWVSPGNPRGTYFGILYLILPAKTIFSKEDHIHKFQADVCFANQDYSHCNIIGFVGTQCLLILMLVKG